MTLTTTLACLTIHFVLLVTGAARWMDTSDKAPRRFAHQSRIDLALFAIGACIGGAVIEMNRSSMPPGVLLRPDLLVSLMAGCFHAGLAIAVGTFMRPSDLELENYARSFWPIPWRSNWVLAAILCTGLTPFMLNGALFAHLWLGTSQLTVRSAFELATRRYATDRVQQVVVELKQQGEQITTYQVILQFDDGWEWRSARDGWLMPGEGIDPVVKFWRTRGHKVSTRRIIR